MTKPEARPNVLFVISDDHRYGAIHAQGDPTVETPTLDGLMAQGVSFDRTYHFGGLTGGVSDHHRVPVFDFDPSGAYPRAARYEGDRNSTEMFRQAAVKFLRGYD